MEREFLMLTVASEFGNFLPKGSKSRIPATRDTLAKNYSQGPPLKFQDESFSAIKFSGSKKFDGRFFPEADRKYSIFLTESNYDVLMYKITWSVL